MFNLSGGHRHELHGGSVPPPPAEGLHQPRPALPRPHSLLSPHHPWPQRQPPPPHSTPQKETVPRLPHPVLRPLLCACQVLHCTAPPNAVYTVVQPATAGLHPPALAVRAAGAQLVAGPHALLPPPDAAGPAELRHHPLSTGAQC